MTSADFCLATSLLCAVGSLQGFVSTTEVLEAPRETKFHLSDSRISRALHIFKELLIHPFAELTPWFPEKMILPQKGLFNLPKLCLNFCEIKGQDKYFPEPWKGVTETNRVPGGLVNCRAEMLSFLGDG